MNFLLDSPQNLLVRQGDICIIYISEHARYKLKVNSGIEIQTKFGALKALDLVGHPYGTKFNLKSGWVLVLRLTPELWTQVLPHRTQILYLADISLICAHLDIKPGSVVVESGTGSGSLSHSIIRSILPDGFLFTFDNDPQRVVAAQGEFQEHGYGSHVKVFEKNVYNDGFGLDLSQKIDACIIDLPEPKKAIEHAYKVLKPDGSRLCIFSIAIEQVTQNVEKMRELKFEDITTYECITLPYDTKPVIFRRWNLPILEGLAAVDHARFENMKAELNPTKKMKISDDHKDVTRQISRDLTDVLYDSDESDIELLKSALSDPNTRFSLNMLPKKALLQYKLPNQTIGHSGYMTFASKRCRP